MRTIIPSELSTPDLHQILLGAVSPRPIAFVSTLSEDGTPNLAPYSFFNVFSSNPPTLIFSSNRRVRGNTTKDTFNNILLSREAVVNVVSHSIVYQMALASVEYDANINEFEKAGLTPVPSDLVKPFRVKESPVQFECTVKDIITLGEGGGAGNLVLCNIERIHLNENILDENDRIDPHKIDLMGRMGRAFYCRASGPNVYPILQPVDKMGIGVDQLPDVIRLSRFLSGNDLARLAAVTAIPEAETDIRSDAQVRSALSQSGAERISQLHQYAKTLVEAGDIDRAWQVLLSG